MNQMIRLPCDNLDSFVQGVKHFYSVNSNDFKKGQHIILYNDEYEATFEIQLLIYFEENTILGLKYVRN